MNANRFYFIIIKDEVSEGTAGIDAKKFSHAVLYIPEEQKALNRRDAEAQRLILGYAYGVAKYKKVFLCASASRR